MSEIATEGVDVGKRGGYRPPYCPQPERIRELCRQIREVGGLFVTDEGTRPGPWSESRLRRAGEIEPAVEMRVVGGKDFAAITGVPFLERDGDW